MKKKKSKKKNPLFQVEKVPPSKRMRVIIAIYYLSFGLVILSALLGIIPSISTFIWKYFDLPIKTILYFLSQFVIFKIGPIRGGLFYILIIIALLLSFGSSVWYSYSKLSKKEKNRVFNILQEASYIIITICVVLVGNILTGQNHVKFDTLFFPEQEENVYTEDDLWQLNQYLENKVVEYAYLMDRDEEGYIIHDDLGALAINDLKKASKKYWVLKGAYPKRVYDFDDYDLSHDPTTLGLTTVDNVGLSTEQEAPELLNTYTHEYCHTKGVVRENEATLCSIIVGLESDNLLSQYSAYMEAYSRSSDAVFLLDSNRARESTKRINRLCTQNGYKEICNNGLKLTKLYVKKSDKLSLSTFSLQDYEDKEFLESYLKNFEDYHLKLYIGEEEISLEDLKSYYDQDVILEIEFDNSREIFEKIQPALEEHKDYFSWIFQEYPTMYDGVDMEPEEALEYYTSSIPNSNILSIFQGQDTLLELFDYSRVVRLILEYFDAENISYFS